MEIDKDRYVSANGESTKNALKTDRYVPKNGRGHLTFMQSTRAMWRPSCCLCGNLDSTGVYEVLNGKWSCVFRNCKMDKFL